MQCLATLMATISIVFLIAPGNASPIRILGIFPHIGKSHFYMIQPLMKALASRGHEVFVISHFPLSTPVNNYTDISVEGAITDFKPIGHIKMSDIYDMSTINTAILLSSLAIDTCETVLKHPNLQNLIKSNQTFDLVIYELFNTDCFLGLVDKFKAPSIAISSCTLMPWAGDRFANPDHPAFIPNLFYHYSDIMTFSERFMNTFYYLVQKVFYNIMYDRPTEKIARKYFGESLPPLQEIAKNTSLVLVNSHFTLNKPRPFVPAIVEIGGLHIRPPRSLPQDLKQFLDGATNGAIYFNMGSMILATSFDDAKRQALVAAFSELPQRVLWKWENDSMSGQPHNVMIRKWLPQWDILNHPNIKVYIGHGGLLGTIEAVNVGVPMVGMPVFGDQKANIANMMTLGMGLKLDYSSITKESVLSVLKEILNNPRYRDNAQRVSRAYKDRPLSPMDTAIFWTEYVIRHRGAPQLRSAAVDLNLVQYLLLDVLGAFLAVVVVIASVIYLLTRKLRLLLCTTSKLKSH